MEIRRTLSRALDKLEAETKASRAKDLLVEEERAGREQAETSRDLYRAEAKTNKDAFLKQKEATESAEAGWKREEERTRELEKKLKRSRRTTQFALLTGVAAAIATLLLLK